MPRNMLDTFPQILLVCAHNGLVRWAGLSPYCNENIELTVPVNVRGDFADRAGSLKTQSPWWLSARWTCSLGL